MMKWRFVLATALAAATLACSSDIRLLRKTSASYASAVARYNAKCVNISVVVMTAL